MVGTKSSSSNFLDFGNGYRGLGKPYSLQLSDIQMDALKTFLGLTSLLSVTRELKFVNRLKKGDGTIYFSRAYDRVTVRNSFTVKYNLNATFRFGQIDFFAQYTHACNCSGVDCRCGTFSAVAFITPFEGTSNNLIIDSMENMNFMSVKLPHIKAHKRFKKETCNVVGVEAIVSKCMCVDLSDIAHKSIVFVQEFTNKTQCD